MAFLPKLLDAAEVTFVSETLNVSRVREVIEVVEDVREIVSLRLYPPKPHFQIQSLCR